VSGHPHAEETGTFHRKIKGDKSLKDIRILIISALNIEQELSRAGSDKA
jgi:hypothetical protein